MEWDTICFTPAHGIYEGRQLPMGQCNMMSVTECFSWDIIWCPWESASCGTAYGVLDRVLHMRHPMGHHNEVLDRALLMGYMSLIECFLWDNIWCPWQSTSRGIYDVLDRVLAMGQHMMSLTEWWNFIWCLWWRVSHWTSLAIIMISLSASYMGHHMWSKVFKVPVPG